MEAHETHPPQACRCLKFNYHLQVCGEKSVIERNMQFMKDRTESLDDYFVLKKE